MYLHEWSVKSQGWEGHREDNAWVRLASGHLLASYCTTLSALCILLHNPCCIVQCYMQVPWLDPSPVIVVLLTYHAHFGDLILLFEYGIASDQMNGCIYYRTYWYISIFDFPKLKLDSTMGWERILRHYFFLNVYIFDAKEIRVWFSCLKTRMSISIGKHY